MHRQSNPQSIAAMLKPANRRSCPELTLTAQTSFDMELYTTKLDTNSGWFNKNKDFAEHIAREIEGRGATNTHQAEERGQKQLRDNDDDVDEEERYSGVQRTAPTTAMAPSGDLGKSKYVPPHLRGAAAGNQAAKAGDAKAEPVGAKAGSPPSPAATSSGVGVGAAVSSSPGTPVSPATPPPSTAPPSEPSSGGGERKKLSFNPDASVFQPALKISFGPPSIPTPSNAPPPVALVAMPGKGGQLPPQPFVMMGPPPPGTMPMVSVPSLLPVVLDALSFALPAGGVSSGLSAAAWLSNAHVDRTALRFCTVWRSPAPAHDDGPSAYATAATLPAAATTSAAAAATAAAAAATTTTAHGRAATAAVAATTAFS
jgi:hypothetical protein